MVRGNLKGVICALTVGFLLTVSAAVVFADSYAQSTPYVFTNIYTYENYAALNVSGAIQGALGLGYILTQDGGDVPAGYMDISAKLYNNAGNIIEAGPYISNTDPERELEEGSGYDSTHGYYQGGADTAVYNGSTYTHYWANETVKLYYPT